MSRIGKHPVALPKGVTAKVEGNTVHVKGPKGELERTLHDEMTTMELDQIADDFIRSHPGAVPAFKGLYNFPG